LIVLVFTLQNQPLVPLKNEDSGADLDLSLAKSPPLYKNKCSLKDFELIYLTRLFSEE